MAKRKSTGKRQRFEIFKRDGFKCAYCGRSPPDVLLHVDHVIAVANGGSSDPTNLITACADCNGGKSSIPLTSVAPALKKQAEDAKERAEQVREYSALLNDLRSEKEESARTMLELFSGSLEWPPHSNPRIRISPSENMTRTMVRFVERLTTSEVFDAIRIAKDAASWKPGLRAVIEVEPDGNSGTANYDNRWRYFCGICWKKIREREEAAKEIA